MGDDRIRPFSTGSQAAEWNEENCERCFRGYDHEKGDYCCPIQRAIDEAGIIGDGTLSPEMAARMGITAETEDRYTWRCAEFVLIGTSMEPKRPADLPGQGNLFDREGTDG